MLRRRILGGALGLSMALGVVACELAVGLDPYQAGCPSGEKACTDQTTNTMACVNIANPNYGCTTTGCRSCAEVNTGINRTLPQDYTCGSTGCVVGNCVSPWQNCDLTKAYCESNSNTDIKNCGTCKTDCTAIQVTANASQTGPINCVQGQCKVTSCDTGYADCDGVPSNGCEVQLGASNCWSCPPPGTSPPACPCKDCYAGAGGQPGVCPACNSGTTCNPATMQCQ